MKMKKQVSDANDPSQNTILFYKKWENYQVIYAGFKNKMFFDQAFVIFSTIRIMYCYLLVGLLYMSPLVQTTQFLILSILMLYYICIRRPMKDPIGLIVAAVYEVLTFVINLCAFILAVCQSTKTLTLDIQTRMSETILITNTAINTCSSIFTWVYIAYAMWGAFKVSRVPGISGKTTWLYVFVAPYSNPGMDFDEKSNHLDLDEKSNTNPDENNSSHSNKKGKASDSCLKLDTRRSYRSYFIESGFGGFVKNNKPKAHDVSNPSFSRRSVAPNIKLNCSDTTQNKLAAESHSETNGHTGISLISLASPTNHRLLEKRHSIISKGSPNETLDKSSSLMEVFQSLNSNRKESQLFGEKFRSSLFLQEKESSLRTRKLIRVRPEEMNLSRSPSPNSNTLKQYDTCLQNPIQETSEDVLPSERFRTDQKKLKIIDFNFEDVEDPRGSGSSISVKHNSIRRSIYKLNRGTTKAENPNTPSSLSRGNGVLMLPKEIPISLSTEICVSNQALYSNKNFQDTLSISMKDQNYSLNSSQPDLGDVDKSPNLKDFIEKNFFPTSPNSQTNRHSYNVRKSRFSRLDANIASPTAIEGYNRKFSMALVYGKKETIFSDKE